MIALGHDPTLRALSGNTATVKHPNAAPQIIAEAQANCDNCRVLTPLELATIYPAFQPIAGPDVSPTFPNPMTLVALCFALPLAFYGAVKLGGDAMRLMLGVQ